MTSLLFVNADTVTDPYANTSTPLREAMRDKHQNVTIKVQILDFQMNYMLPKFRNFEKLTGATIEQVDTTTATWYQDVEDDITNHYRGFIDLYASFGNWIPQFVELGGLLDISEQVGQVGLDWFDIMPAVRMGVATYQQKIYAVPLDGDVIIMIYRTDLVEDVGLPTPRTWDDVLEILEYYNETDTYGNCFSTQRNDIADKMFWAIAASFLQREGTTQGIFFDPKSMNPISSTPGFIDVLKIYKKLVLQSPCNTTLDGVDWKTTKDMFLNGECVLFYNYPGVIKQIISSQEIAGLSGVLNIAPLPGMKCNGNDDCPYASKYGANHAPFLASGGMAYAVNVRISEEKQKAALDFAFYLSDPAVSFWDVANSGSFLDPLRLRHTASLSNNETAEAKAFLSFGWENRQLGQLKEVTEFNFLHKNYVLDLRIFGAEAYQEEGTIIHLLNMCKGDATFQETADAITKSWNKVTKTYGLKEQRNAYRDTLGLPPYEDTHNIIIIMCVTIPIALLFIILIAALFKQRHTIKYKTRDVNTAPKTGTIALIFTDVEGSTSLWDSSKTTMSKALAIHHDVIRSCIDKHKAYEVKTIGDSFMIASGSADTAVMVANDIQLDLLNADWPVELAGLPSSCVEYFNPHSKHSSEPPRPMFRGLRVRIGVHVGEHSTNVEEGGEVQVMYDKVAKGYDYYGPLSNAAARIEHIGFGGQTIISSGIYSRLSNEVKGECSFVAVGAMRLRGVSEAMYVHQCLPNDLKDRKFDGVYRRRESDSGTVDSSDQDMMMLSLHPDDGDLSVDVMTLNPVELQKVAKKLQDRVAMLQLRDLQSSSSNISRLSFRMGGRSSTRMSNSMLDVVDCQDIKELAINDEDEDEDGNNDNLSYGDVTEIRQYEKEETSKLTESDVDK